jgi:glycerophosphoryl diester phosphodiesterase
VLDESGAVCIELDVDTTALIVLVLIRELVEDEPSKTVVVVEASVSVDVE